MKQNFKYFKSVIILTFVVFITGFSQVRLPKLISNGMVLQRDTKLKIWGWAAKNEKVSICFLDSNYNTKADSEGEWNVILPELKAGGPFTMRISAINIITISDIMVGDVWVCSGQSNMVMSMAKVAPIYETEIINSVNKYIRQFHVPEKYNFNEPQTDYQSGTWKTANPENVLDFSAVAYYFAKEIYNKYHIPIGLINASLGGSPVESWISEESLKAFPSYFQEAQQF